MPADSTAGDMTFAFIAASVAAIVGIVAGIEKIFQLRVQAQTVLCQLQIEANTRAASG